MFKGPSGSCETCAEGFYAKNNTCEQCANFPQCSGECYFLASCFNCSSGYYDLASNQCVSNCSNAQIVLEGAGYSNLRFCRGFEYFVDSSSNYSVELGNKQYPYKSINAAFIEIVNLHSNTDRNISIFVKEQTMNFVNSNSLKVL